MKYISIWRERIPAVIEVPLYLLLDTNHYASEKKLNRKEVYIYIYISIKTELYEK